MGLLLLFAGMKAQVNDAFQGVLPVTDPMMKKSLNGEWQLVETWKPGDSKPEVVDPSEVRITWKFSDSGDLLQETTYMHGPAMANMFKWNLNGNNIYLFNYIDPNKFEKSYDIVRYGGTNPILKIREWTSEYSYKIMKFKSMAAG